MVRLVVIVESRLVSVFLLVLFFESLFVICWSFFSNFWWCLLNKLFNDLSFLIIWVLSVLLLFFVVVLVIFSLFCNLLVVFWSCFWILLWLLLVLVNWLESLEICWLISLCILLNWLLRCVFSFVKLLLMCDLRVDRFVWKVWLVWLNKIFFNWVSLFVGWGVFWVLLMFCVSWFFGFLFVIKCF